jgi:hypothetical protein
LLLEFIVCVYRDTRQGRGFRSDFPPFVFVLQIKKKNNNQTQSDEIICLAEVMLDCELLMRDVRTYITLAPERAARVPYRRTSHNHEIFEWWICCCFFLLCVNKAGDGLDRGKECLEGGRRWDNPSSI